MILRIHGDILHSFKEGEGDFRDIQGMFCIIFWKKLFSVQREG